MQAPMDGFNMLQAGAMMQMGPAPTEMRPSMMEMVSQAIATMGSRKGSSLQAIKKFLTERYGIDFTNSPEEKNRVSKAVKLGVSRGVFIQEKNSYRLATAQMDPMVMRQPPPHMGYPGHPGAPQMHPHQHQQHPHAHHPQQHPGHPGQPPHFGGGLQQFAPMSYPGMQTQYMGPQFFPPQPQHMQAMPAMMEPVKKKKKKKKKDGVIKRRGAGGLSKPMLLSDDLAQVCGGHSMGRTDVVKNLWQYIKSNNLQDPSNKKMIMCDERLRRVFNNQERVDMFTMTKMISDHLTKPDNQDELQAQMAAAQQQPQGFYADQQYDDANEADDDDKAHQVQQEQWSC
ncbi:Histone H1 [Hondaea fermentalgiana]|uniref:Histone H1 n=1 Tax=Hondaea fermentalgiana TaxID=2315210 RepID=A0A2R5GKI4_9STRA|nr:Histone H1 [Hondaea fermentalgiana]|eukprot:GBG28384.1 Histone H1 [Hondaea fermentalgiana]